MGARLMSIKAAPENGEQVRPIIEQTGKGDLLCHESTSGRWFRSSLPFVKKELEWLNKKCENKEYDTIGLDELFRALGLYSVSQFMVYGWRLNDLPFRTELFDSKMHENGYLGMNEPVLVIQATRPAIKDYYKEV